MPSAASWGEFEAAAPDMAAWGRKLLYRDGVGDALFTTVSGTAPPRTHPVNLGIVDGRLLVFVQDKSAKMGDLAADGRYAVHSHQDPAEPHEFLLRGRAVLVTDAAIRRTAIADWPFTPGDTYGLYELAIEHALFGERASPKAWPPHYTSWRPPARASL